MLLMAVALSLVAGLANVVGAVAVLARPRWPAAWLERFLAFSAGFLLAIAFTELLPESVGADPGNAVFLLLGFMGLHLIEKFLLDQHVHGHAHDHGPEDPGHCHEGTPPERRRSFGLVTLAGMALHTFFDGVSIGAGFSLGLTQALLIFFAVLLHKVPDGFVIASVMLAAREGRGKAFLAAVALAFSTVLGTILTALLTNLYGGAEGGFGGFSRGALAFSAGIFIYVAASDLIPEVNHSKSRLLPLVVLLGMAAFYASSGLIGSLIGE